MTYDKPSQIARRLAEETTSQEPEVVDLRRGNAPKERDRSEHRTFHWLYEDLLN